MNILSYVSTLTVRDYKDWLALPSIQTGFPENIIFLQNFSYLWIFPFVLSLYSVFHIDWGAPLVSLFQVLAAVNVVTALTVAELYEEILVDYLPVCAHFLLWGCSRKYRSSRWYPPALPPYAAACLSAYFGVPLASLVVLVHYMARKHKSE